MSLSAFSGSFQFDVRVPAGVEDIAVAVDRVENLCEISEEYHAQKRDIYKFCLRTV